MTDKKPMDNKTDLPELKKLEVQGNTYYTTLTKKFENRKKWSKPDEKKVISYIPGTVKQVFVREGDHVRAADKLLIIEAMKMMNTIYSPIEGEIKTISVSEGDCIPKGSLLIEFK
jgi:biotin carboxyl carrier protein